MIFFVSNLQVFFIGLCSNQKYKKYEYQNVCLYMECLTMKFCCEKSFRFEVMVGSMRLNSRLARFHYANVDTKKKILIHAQQIAR